MFPNRKYRPFYATVNNCSCATYGFLQQQMMPCGTGLHNLAVLCKPEAIVPILISTGYLCCNGFVISLDSVLHVQTHRTVLVRGWRSWQEQMGHKPCQTWQARCMLHVELTLIDNNSVLHEQHECAGTDVQISAPTRRSAALNASFKPAWQATVCCNLQCLLLPEAYLFHNFTSADTPMLCINTGAFCQNQM